MELIEPTISILTREDTPVAMCVVCLHKSHTYPNLQDTFLNTGICTMQRTTECCLNRLPYFLKCAVNQNTLSFNY